MKRAFGSAAMVHLALNIEGGNAYEMARSVDLSASTQVATIERAHGNGWVPRGIQAPKISVPMSSPTPLASPLRCLCTKLETLGCRYTQRGRHRATKTDFRPTQGFPAGDPPPTSLRSSPRAWVRRIARAGHGSSLSPFWPFSCCLPSVFVFFVCLHRNANTLVAIAIAWRVTCCCLFR